MPDYQYLDISKLMHCGVYALMRKGEIVYVGKSKSPLGRLHSHIKNRGCEMPGGRRTWGGAGSTGPTHNGRGINFDGILFYPCMLGQLDVIEAVLIREHLPRYNTRGMPPKPIPVELKALLAQAGWMVITGLPQIEDSPKVYIRRML